MQEREFMTHDSEPSLPLSMACGGLDHLSGRPLVLAGAEQLQSKQLLLCSCAAETSVNGTSRKWRRGPFMSVIGGISDGLRFSQFDPNVWSGRALQEDIDELVASVGERGGRQRSIPPMPTRAVRPAVPLAVKYVFPARHESAAR